MVFSKLRQIKTNIGDNRANKSKHIVALDIGTEYAKALVAKIKGDQLEIIGVGRQRQRLSDMHSGAVSDIAGVVENCDKALEEAENQSGVSARQAIIGIAGELVKGTTSTIHYKRPDGDREITFPEMEMIINKVQDRAYAQAKNQLRWETGNDDLDIKLVNSAIVAIHSDGYKISNPIGFTGKDVAIQLYTAFAPQIHLGALEKSADDLDLDLVAVAAEPFAVSRSVVGTDASTNLSAILIDVGGGTTDIAVVDDGGVVGTKMFGIGGRVFTRNIANDMDKSFDEAEELKLQLGTGELEKKAEEKLNASANKVVDVWLSGVELALSEFEDIDHLPNKIQLCGGGSSLKALIKALEERDWYKDLPFTRKPTVQLINPKQVDKIVDTTGKIKDHTFITAMGLLRVGYDTIADDQQDQTVTEKLNKMLRI